MRKLVSIIIPYYNENESQLAIALSSINNQIGVDFNDVEVILVGDGGYEIDDISVFDIFDNINLHYYYNRISKGAGCARQFGMEHSSGRYYMFIDADDQLHFAGALLEFFNVIANSGNHEIIIAKYIEQYKIEDGTFRYYTHPQNDWKASYAKWFSAEYIERIGLRWHDDLRIYEDTYFVGLSCKLSDDIYYHNSVVYSWLYNPNSTVRKKENNFYNQLHDWSRMNYYYINFLKEHNYSYLQNDFNNYWIELYSKEKNYEPIDSKKYIYQNCEILKSNAIMWEKCKIDLKENIIKRLQENNQYIDGDINDVNQYVNTWNSHFKNIKNKKTVIY